LPRIIGGLTINHCASDFGTFKARPSVGSAKVHATPRKGQIRRRLEDNNEK